MYVNGLFLSQKSVTLTEDNPILNSSVITMVYNSSSIQFVIFTISNNAHSLQILIKQLNEGKKYKGISLFLSEI